MPIFAGAFDLFASLAPEAIFGAAEAAAPAIDIGLMEAGPSVLGTAADFLAPAAAAGESAILGGGPTAIGTIGDILGLGGAAGAVGAGGLAGLGAGTAGPNIPGGVFGDFGALTNPAGTSFAPTTGPTRGNPAFPSGGLPSTSAPPAAPGGGGPGAGGPIATDPTAATPSVFDTGTSPVTAPGVSGATGSVGGTPPVASSAAGGGDVLSKLGGFLGSNAGKGLEALLGVGGLGYSIYSQKQQQEKALNALNAEKTAAANAQAATTAAAQPTLQTGQQLIDYLSTGTLPAAMQAQLDQAIAARKAQIIANAGQQGLSTDPTKNSALGQDLANVDQQAQSTKGQLEQTLQQAGTQLISTANSLIATGLNATQMSSQLEEYLISLDQTMSANTGKAIANFAAALGGGFKPTGQSFTLTPAAP